MRLAKRKYLNKQLRKARNRAKILGTAARPRLSIFRSNRYIAAQLIDDALGRTLAAASSRTLREGKGKASKTDAAKRVGAMIADAAKKLGIAAAVFNKGPYKYHGRVKAVADGAREGGLKI